MSSANRKRSSKRSLVFETIESRRMLAGIEITDREQLLLELVNRARANPIAEVARYGIDLNQGLAPGSLSPAAKQPLALNQFLASAARLHAVDMLANNYFSHTDLGGRDHLQRMSAAGYTGSGEENINWSGTTGQLDAAAEVFKNHEQLIRSAGHRAHIMDNGLDELGTGIAVGPYTFEGKTYNTSMVTELFGRSLGQVFITGVAFSDRTVADEFYSVGEGLSGLNVVARAVDGTTYQTQTGSSGGYSLPVAQGTYQVTFSGGTLAKPITMTQVVVQDSNVKVDLNASRVASLDWSTSITSASENLGTVNLTLRRSGYTANSLNVSLSSADTFQATVPATVTFEPGATSISVPVTLVNDNQIDGDVAVLLKAQANAASEGSWQLTVIDDDAVQLALQATSTSLAENGASILATLSRSSANGLPLTVSLVSNDPTAVTAPSTVTIPANALSVTFTVTPVDDTELDGTQFSSIIASATSVVSASLRFSVTDNETGSAWTNPSNSVDVNNDGIVSGLDALLIINQINAGNSGSIRDLVLSSPDFFDVNGDESITALDVLLVFNKVNRYGV